MARAATSPELVLFRTPGQFSIVRAAIKTPATIYSGRINQSFSSLDKVLEIVYDGGSGTLASALQDMTVLFGSTAGAWDKGITRLRAIDSSKLYIGETADIRFANDDYFTIIDDFSLWAKPVLISGATPYMDGGVAYTDQHTNFLPWVIMGPNRVLKKTGSTVSASFDFSASYVPGSSVSSRATTAPGSSSITGATTATPTVTWNSTGWKKVYHTVTGANGKSFFGVRDVFVWDPASPPEPIERGALRGDTESGGWELEVTLYNQANLSEVRDHALIILFSEDYYGSTNQEIGPVAGAENIVFSGWIAGESIQWSSDGGSVSFKAYTAHYFLQKIPAWPDGIEFTSLTPGAWTQMKDLTVDLGLLHHFLMWRSTAPRIMDIYGSGDTRLTKEVASLAADLWNQIIEMAFDQIFARPICNRLNQLYIEIHPQLVALASRSWPTVLTLLEKDIEEPNELERVTMAETSIVDLSGVSINSSGAVTPYFSLSPGHSHSHYGSPLVVSRLLLASQSQANQLAGLYRGWMNNPYAPLSLRLAANNRLIDIAPRQKCALAISSGDTIRELAASLGLIPLSIEESFEAESGWARQEVTFEVETFEDISVNGDVPGSGDVSIPPVPPLPPLPPFDPIPPGTGSESEEIGSRVILHSTSAGLLYTSSFDDSSPTWLAVNSGLTPDQYQQINIIVITPSGGIYVAHRNRTGFGTSPFIAYAPSIGSTFTIIEDVASIQAKFPTRTTYSAVNALGVNPLTGQVAYVLSGDGGGVTESRIYVGSGTSFSAGAAPTLHVGSVGSLSFGFNEWRLTGYNAALSSRFIVFSAGGGSIVRDVNIGGTANFDSSPYHTPISTTDAVFNWRSGGLLKITANGAIAGDFTTVLGSGLNVNNDNTTETDPTGFFIMADWDTGRRGKSSDGSSSWSGIPGLPYVGGGYSFDFIDGEGVSSRWVAALGSTVRYTEDFGTTWDSKEGNLLSVAPLGGVDIIKVIP